jgi:hypothetical protein
MDNVSCDSHRHTSTHIISLNTINQSVFVINTDYSQCEAESKTFMQRLDEFRLLRVNDDVLKQRDNLHLSFMR